MTMSLEDFKLFFQIGVYKLRIIKIGLIFTVNEISRGFKRETCHRE